MRLANHKFIISYNVKTNDILEQYGCVGRKINVVGRISNVPVCWLEKSRPEDNLYSWLLQCKQDANFSSRIQKLIF